jgi:DNA-binding MarR family transcriptional regulator
MVRPWGESAAGLAQTAWLLSRAERCLTAQLEDSLGGVSIERWRTLVLLSDGTGHAMTELARFALLPAPSLTRLIDGMVSESLVYRTADPGDGRRVLVPIAPRGVALHRSLEAQLERLEAALWPSAADAEQLMDVLTQVVEHLETPPAAERSASGSARLG